ncbi:MAG: hypothetical protein WB992_11375 [Bryobacteraceae bacterium]
MSWVTASELGRRSWAATTAEEKAAHVKMLGETRAASLTPAQRSEIARRAAQARWAKAKK